MSGRSGNNIASAVVKISKNIVKDIPYISKIILWSDSCVLRNKNSIMSLALLNFLKSENSGKIEIIEQKLSEPGHGNLKEIDAAHSVIERYTKNLEIYSPIGLIRVLKNLQIK